MNNSLARVMIKILLSIIILIELNACSCRREKSANLAHDLIVASRTLEDRAIELPPSRYVIVNFWASWCGPCIQETPSLMRLAKENPDLVSLIAISEDESLKDLKKFLRLYPMVKAPNIFITHDLDRRLALGFGVKKFPETFVFNRDFKLLKKVDGAVEWSPALLQTLLPGETK